MAQERTPLDRLIDPAVERVGKSRSYFKKSEVIAEVRKNRALNRMLTEMRNKYRAWKFDQIIVRYMEGAIGSVLQRRDANGIRIYECYSVGSRERRWQPLRAMTLTTLRAVMAEARTQARQLELKGEGYEYFEKELEKLGPNARVEQVYDQAVPLILAHRAS